ncbi:MULTISPECIES: flagellar export protein FliJ [unclassified Methylophilus]|jgi:flagellar FliJ protein|uniref:Flagellar FliJ protein n=1 Tax=Methylophilus glucosoxydans TaxID=752553 RepID=A0ABW3GK52_9PROT|nr:MULTISPECIES: flagellar export protein FliJ [unclassified Methylophilus]MBF5038151.1 flagellar export protein FliJ [Methylophilus sp. 13]MDF0376659.1 flagellar export protein FliJ [Methylophilus sp. YYY-1]MDT7850557.1 flagellar export protein FliJ [Methylophilus sp. VKM B-3414]BEV07882.1 flagellar export protein FliJ [Methylophilus sp. DW102]
MAKQSTQTLTLLNQLAADEVEAAMQALAQAMQQLEQAQQQQVMLAQYQQEYEQQWQQVVQNGLKADLYRNFQGFFSQLELAVRTQNAQIEQCQAIVQQQRLRLQEKQRKQKSYEVLITRAQTSQAKAENKRDQKMMDEFASRARRARW